MGSISRKLDAYVAPMTIKSLAKPNSSKLDASVAPMTIFVRSLANLYYYAFHYQGEEGQEIVKAWGKR